MSSKVNIQGYDQWSKFYDQYPNPTVAIDHLFFPRFYEDVKEQNVLEIGCGTGRHTAILVQRKNQIVAIDASQGMLEKAQQNVSDSQVRWIHGNFLKEAIESSFYDSLIMSLVLEHIFDLSSFFEKVNYHLKPGGSFYFSEIHPERSEQGALAHFRLEEGGEYYLDSRAHKESEIEKAIVEASLSIERKQTVCGVKELVSLSPKWSRYLDKPMIQMWMVKKIEK